MTKHESGRGITTEVREMTKRLKRFALGLVALGMCLALLLTAAIPVCEARPRAKEIVVGIRGCWTGPLAGVVGPFANGTKDYLRYLNETQGGINGVPIKIAWYDNHSEGYKDIILHKRFVSAGAVLEYTYISAGAWATLAMQERDKIALFSNEIDPGMNTDPQWVWCTVPPWKCHTATFVKWVKENWTEERPPRVGYVCYDNAAAIGGKDKIPEFCDKIGVEWVGFEIVPLFGCIDTSTELLRLAAKKPDWIYVDAYGVSEVTVCKDAARLGLKDKGIKFCACPQSVDKIFVGTTGASSEGWYAGRVIPSPWEDEYLGGAKTPEMAIARKYIEKYRGLKPEEQSEWLPCGWAVGKIGCEAIRRALEKVGIDNLTGRAVRDALFSMTDWDTGIQPAPITLSDEKPYFIDYWLVYQVQQGKVVPVYPPVLYVSPSEFGGKL